MKTVVSKLGLLGRLSITTVALLISQYAMADGADTNYDTDISNQATVSYDVAGNAQTPVDSNIETFKVDRMIVFTNVEADGLLTSTMLGNTGDFIEFTVTNLSNGPMDFNLTVLTPQVATDDFDMLVPTIQSDIGGGVFTGGPYIDDLAENASVAVRIFANTPLAGPTNGQISNLSLLATAADPGGSSGAPGANLTQGGVWNKNALDNVFANASGEDAGGNATEAAEDGYVIEAPVITVDKAASVVSDPFSSVDPKAIPGAVMRYLITIDNSGADAASSVSISDLINTNLTLLVQDPVGNPGVSVITITDDGGATSTCDAELGGVDTDSDGCVFGDTADTLDVGGASAFDVPAGETWTVEFDVVIN